MDLVAGFTTSGASPPDIDRSLYTMLEPEGQRYAAFFATLEQTAPQLIARATAVAFFLKSSLGEPEVEALYASVKSVGVQPDAAVMNETEFVLAMHLIVCRTKRGLATVPQPFPTYLFPTVALPTSNGHAPNDRISSMPSPDKPSGLGLGETAASFGKSSLSNGGGGGGLPPTSWSSTTAATEVSKLTGSKSLVELAQKEVQNHQVLKTQLLQIDQCETTTLASLQKTLHALAMAVDQLGFPVPLATHASIGAIDDLGNLLRANIQSIKHEIQSLEISARMRSVADEATSRTNSREGGGIDLNNMTAATTDTSAAIAQVASLSSQLATLQHEATQLRAKKESLTRQLLDKKSSAPSPPPVPVAIPPPIAIKTVSDSSPPPPPPAPQPPVGESASSSWGAFGVSSATVAPLASPQDADAFGFGDFAASVPAATSTTAPQPQDSDFGWGAF